LHPLTRDGHIREARGITGRLKNRRISVYDSPDLPTVNNDFYALMIHRRDSRLKVLVADTDQYPDANGVDLYGIYLIEEGQLKRIQDYKDI
jgi:hypothetical protein